MLGFQCSASVQPVFGRTSLFPSSPSSQSTSSSPFSSRSAPGLLDYFPGAGNDGLRLTWANGINSRSLLDQALISDEWMLGADVTLAETTRYPIPIMSSPPLNMSDITLEDWLVEVVRADTGKGIKLDLKSTRVVEPAFRVLARHFDYIKGPLVLNANILPGYKSSVAPIDAWTFLMLCRTRFSKSIISIGWTIEIDELTLKTGYTREMVDQMASLVKEYNLLQPVTFLVNAALLKPSIGELQRLLYQVPNSSITLWANPGDPYTFEDLLMYRKNFSPNQVFYNLPGQTLDIFRSQVYHR